MPSLGVLPQGQSSGQVFTTLSGCPIAHMKNSLTAGPHGPVMLQDNILLEKLTQFTREQIPSRNVHALGIGAYGTFKVTGDITKYTRAALFQPGKSTDLFVRMSGTFTEKGEADLIRDLRGFAVKFYTEEGNWDLLCINAPVFNCRDGKVGPDAVHGSKRDPITGAWNPTQLWDFTLTHPEGLHFVTMLHTDRVGTPASWRKQHYWASNTYSLVNDRKERHWVKFHWVSEQGFEGLTANEAKLLAGEDPDFLKRDFNTAIKNGNFPKWKLCIQVMPEAEGYTNPIAFDCTKVWCHKDFPLIEVGMLELNKLPTDHFTEVEQAAFSPLNTIPGVGFSPDKLLQARLLIYDDAQHHRIGPNHKMIPVNRPKNATVNAPYNGGGNFHMTPNKWPQYYPSNYSSDHPDPTLLEPAIKVDGPVDFYNYPLDGTPEDIYGQTTEFWKTLDIKQQENLCLNIATSISKIPEDLARMVIAEYKKVDQTCGTKIEQNWQNRLSGNILMTEAEKLLEKANKTMVGV